MVGFEFVCFEDREELNAKLFAMKDGNFFKGYFVEIDLSERALRSAKFYPDDVEKFNHLYRAKKLEELYNAN